MRLFPLFPIGIALAAGSGAQVDLIRAVDAAFSGHWVGTLTYKDYQPPHGQVSLPTTLDVNARADGSLKLAFAYNDGPHKTVHATDDFAVASDGKTVGWSSDGSAPTPGESYTVTEWQPEQHRFVMTSQGRDDDQPATIRYTVIFSSDDLDLKKETAGEGKPFAFRHEYRFHRG